MYARTIFLILLMMQLQREAYSQRGRGLFKDSKYVKDDSESTYKLENMLCRYKVTNKSEEALQDLILENKYSIVHVTLNFPDEVIFPEARFQDILEKKKWIWIWKSEGIKLLKIDFRFEFYSLGMLTSDVGYLTLNLTTKCNERSNGTMKIKSIRHLMSVLQYSLGSYIYPNSSLCYHKLAKTPHNFYYTQPYCCSFHVAPKCGHYVELYTDDWFVIMVYILVFLLSPLLLSALFTKPKEIFILESNGILRKKKSIANKKLDKLELRRRSIKGFDGVDFPKYVKTQSTREEQGATDTTPTKLKSKDPNNESEANEPISPIEPLWSEPCTSSPIEAEVNKGIQYIPYNKDIPVRITRPLKFLLLMNSDNAVIGVIRRLLFFILLYPIVMYIYLLVVHFKYSEEVMFLVDVERKLNITGQLLNLFSFDQLYAGNFFSNPHYMFWSISMVAYGVTAVIFASGVPLYMLTDRLALDDGYMGFIKLPPKLRQKTTYDQGTKKIQRKMIHRLSLMINPNFWSFWFRDLVALFKCQEKCGPKEPLVRILWFIGYIFSLLNFFPLVNCLPLEMIARGLRKPEESTTRQLVKKYGRHQVAKLLGILLGVVVSVMGLLFTMFVFIESSRIVGLIIVYSVRGAVKNYLQVMPILSIILAGWQFLNTTLGNVEIRYLYYKKLIFDACQEENERLESNFDADDKTMETLEYPLVIYRKDGIPLIPRDLYYNVLYSLFPLSKHELPAIGQILFTAGFLYLIATTIDVFSEDSITSLGEALATLLAATLPNILQTVFKYDLDDISTDRHVLKVQAEIRRFYSLKPVTSGVEGGEAETADDALNVEIPLVDEKKSLAEGEDETSV